MKLTHYIKTMLRKIVKFISRVYLETKKFINKIRKIKATEVFQIFSCTLVFIGLLSGLDFLSKKPSLGINFGKNCFMLWPEVALYSEDIYEYYKSNGYSIPESLKEIIPIDVKRAGVKSEWQSFNAKFEAMGDKPLIMPDEEEKLEKIIKSDGKLDEKIYFLDNSYLDSSRLMEAVKKRITGHEYLTFLTAIIDSRIFWNCLEITNTGNVDLNNIFIEIPAPYSVITNQRDGNIKDIQTEPFQTRYSYELKPKQLSLNIRELKIKDGFSISVFTKGNKIDRNEITFNYASVRTIDSARYLWYLLIIFSLLLFIFCFWKNRVEKI